MLSHTMHNNNCDTIVIIPCIWCGCMQNAHVKLFACFCVCMCAHRECMWMGWCLRCFCVFGHCYPKPLNGRYILLLELFLFCSFYLPVFASAPAPSPSPPSVSAFQKDSKWYCDMHTHLPFVVAVVFFIVISFLTLTQTMRLMVWANHFNCSSISH